MTGPCFKKTFFMISCGIAVNFSQAQGTQKQESKSPPILDATALQDGREGVINIDPCVNFYQFSCGEWLKNTEIPADKTAISHSGTALIDETDENLNKILVRLVDGDAAFKIKSAKPLADLYTSCMNAEKNGAEAKQLLEDKVTEINKMKEPQELARIVANLHLLGASPFFGFASDRDMKNSEKVIGALFQSGMGLPEPSYYFDKDEKSVAIREQYVVHISKMFQIAGENKEKSDANANMILALETELAAKAYSKEQENNPLNIYHPTTRKELKAQVPKFDWTVYFKTVSAPDSQLNLQEPEFFVNLNQIIAKTSLADIKKYLIWNLLKSAAPKVNSAFEQESFRFWESYLNGVKEMKPLWKKCTQVVKNNLDYALAEAYVSTIDTAVIRARADEMILQIKQSFREDLDDLTNGPAAWFDAPTQVAAIEKLKMMKQKVGAPEKWEDYSEMKTDKNSYFLNYIKIKDRELRKNLARIGMPVDHDRWDMMPWEVNAYYSFAANEFVLPFGILQPPMFDLTASKGANLAALGGGTIGHELIHGFDNNGKQMDAYGNLKDWWTAVTEKGFEQHSQCYVEQANQYRIEDTKMNVNGKLTLSENLADQGGVKLGYTTLLKEQAKQTKPEPLWIGKYTENQQYWIAYAQSWCTKKTQEALRLQMTTDEHPPEEFRVNGIIMNRPEFARDFKCTAGAPMAPVKRCTLW